MARAVQQVASQRIGGQGLDQSILRRGCQRLPGSGSPTSRRLRPRPTLAPRTRRSGRIPSPSDAPHRAARRSTGGDRRIGSRSARLARCASGHTNILRPRRPEASTAWLTQHPAPAHIGFAPTSSNITPRVSCASWPRTPRPAGRRSARASSSSRRTGRTGSARPRPDLLTGRGSA